MKEYRTEEQLYEILESMVNGNWSQAALQCVDYGFYARDLIHYGEDNQYGVTMSDFVLLIEMATQLRSKE